MKQALVLAVLMMSLISYSQHETYEYSHTKEGKLRYEFQVHKSREYLVENFFELFAQSKKVWIMEDDHCIAIARKTKKGLEVIGDGRGEKFDCDPANLCVDLWLEFAHVNSL